MGSLLGVYSPRGPPSMPSIALYRVTCEEGLVSCCQSDERGRGLALGGGDRQNVII